MRTGLPTWYLEAGDAGGTGEPGAMDRAPPGANETPGTGVVLEAGCPRVYQIMVAGRQFRVAIGSIK